MPVLIVGPLQHDDEFIPADAEDRTVLPGVADQLAGAADIGVPFNVSETVVDLLETVDVTDHDRKLPELSLTDLLLQRFHVFREGRFVLYARHLIPIGFFIGGAQPLFDLLLFSDLLVDIHDADDQMLVVRRPDDGQPRIHDAVSDQQPIGMRDHMFSPQHLDHGRFIQNPVKCTPILRMDHPIDVGKGFSEEVVSGRPDIETLIRVRGRKFDIVVVQHVHVVDGVVLVGQARRDLVEGRVFGQRLFDGVFLLDLMLDIHNAHDQVLPVTGPEHGHSRIGALPRHNQPVGHREGVVFLQSLQHRWLVEGGKHLLPVVRMDDHADIALGGHEKVAADGADVEILVFVGGGELDIAVRLGVDVIDHAVLPGQTLRDLREDHVFLGDIFHRLLASDLFVDVLQRDDQVVAIVDAHSHEPHMMGSVAHQQPVFHQMLLSALRGGYHEILIRDHQHLVQILRMDHPQDVFAGLLEEVAALLRDLQLPVIVAGGILRIVMGDQVHIVDRGIAVGQRFGDGVVSFGRFFCPDRLVHVQHAQDQAVLFVGGIAQDAHGVVDRLAVDHQAIHDGECGFVPQLTQERFPPQRVGHHLLVLRINHRKDVPLTIAEKILPGREQLKLLVSRIRAVAFIAACLEVDVIYA